jgi:conjugal transfer pilus assembly protein TraF
MSVPMKSFLKLLLLTVAVSGQAAYADASKAPVSQVPTAAVPRPQAAERSSAQDYCDRNLGRWFYCETPEPDADTPAPKAEAPKSQADNDADAAAKFRADMEKARQAAVWNPTEENLKRYFALQKVTLDKAGLFADNWRRMIWADPSMDYNLVRPVSDLGKSEWMDERNGDRDLFFRRISAEVGSCGPCRVQGPIMYNFNQRYGINIHGISTDGSKSALFPDTKPDQGQLAAWGINNKVTPAYLIFQRSNLGADGQVHPVDVTVSDGKVIHLRPCPNPNGCLNYVGAGILSVDDLADRLFVVLGTESGKDF